MLRRTGNSARFDRALVAEVLAWLAFYLAVRARAALRGLRHPPGPAIWFTPDVPHPRYLVRTAAIRAGLRLARWPAEADAAFFFDDTTVGTPPPAPCPRAFNFGCADISKSRVARVFEDVFGYPLAIDPATHLGEAVEKGETNGAHDGRIVDCPRPAMPGRVYERLIDTVRADGFAYDLRTHCIDGTPVVVWVKRRDRKRRFLPPNLAVTQHAPAEVFTAHELARIGAFARAMGADWCGLDILRDEPSGRIYIVDVNKTDAGPIIALSLKDKLASTALLADALLAMIDRPQLPTTSTSNEPGTALGRSSPLLAG